MNACKSNATKKLRSRGSQTSHRKFSVLLLAILAFNAPVLGADLEVLPATIDVSQLPWCPPLVHLSYRGQEGSVVTGLRLRDGKKLITGWFTEVNGVRRPGLARLDATHEVDESFAPPLDLELLTHQLFPLRELRSGALLGVDYDGRLNRLLTDGTRDPAFSPPFTNGFLCVAESGDETLWAVRSNSVFHLTAAGTLIDRTTLAVATSGGFTVFGIQANGKVLTEYFDPDLGHGNIHRWFRNGEDDPSFHPIDGWFWRPSFVLANDRILLGERVLFDSDGNRLSDYSGVAVEWRGDTGDRSSTRIDEETLYIDACCAVSLNGIPVDPRLRNFPLLWKGGHLRGVQMSAWVRGRLSTDLLEERPSFTFPSDPDIEHVFIVVFRRLGSTENLATIRYTSLHKSGSETSYFGQDGVLTFGPFEPEKRIEIPIADDFQPATFEVIVTEGTGFDLLPQPMTLSIGCCEIDADPSQIKRLHDGRLLIGGNGQAFLQFSEDLRIWQTLTNLGASGFSERAVWLDSAGQKSQKGFYRTIAP